MAERGRFGKSAQHYGGGKQASGDTASDAGRSRPPIVKEKFKDVDAEKALMAKESAIKKSQTKGLQEVGKQRRGKLLGILADPTTSKADKLNRIWEQNLTGAYKSSLLSRNPEIKKNPRLRESIQERIKNKRFNLTDTFGALDPRRHLAFNNEMTNTIREYAEEMGVTDAWTTNKFIDKLYNYTGAAQAAAMYPGTELAQNLYSAAYQVADAIGEMVMGKSNPAKAAADAASDFFQNVKGQYAGWGGPTDSWKTLETNEDQLLDYAFKKIDEYVGLGE